MVAFPSPTLESADMEKAMASRTSRSHPHRLRWMWALQGLVAIPRLFLIILVSIIVLSMYPMHHSPPGAMLVWIICAVDICMTITLITTIIVQYRDNPTASAATTLRREATKTVFATYLWLWTFFGDPKCIFPPDDSPSGLIPKDEVKLFKIRMYEGLITVIVVLIFYPALWMAYRDWRAARNTTGSRDVEVVFAVEEQEGLLDRNSIDTLGTFLSEDDESDKRKW